MKKQATKRTERVVTDLPVRNDDAVKGGTTPTLYSVACKGTHIPNVVVE
ncbi:MAG TPA: hypothetical protein VFJ24_06640 [Gaiellales bacterium]|nr:hypothetical protein [Gaiellales bacterium]